jgi:hypothetical protein
MNYAYTNAALKQELQKVIDLARRNLGVSKPWLQNDGSTRRKKIDTTGTLWKSLQITDITETDGVFSIGIMMEGYGNFIDQGVSGTRYKTPQPSPFSFKNDGVSRAMQSNILKWMGKKRIRLRDLTTGKFKKGGASSRKGLAYVIARGVKRKGINQTFFLTKPLNATLETLPVIIAEAIFKDLENQ